MSAGPSTYAPLRGVLLLATAVLVLAGMDTATKYLVARYEVPVVMAARYAIHMLVIAAVLYPRHGRQMLRTRRTGLVVLRSLCLVATSLLMGLGLQRMPVAETTAIFFLTPVAVALLAPAVLGERTGAAGWVACAVGFAGVLLVVRPGGGLDPVGVAFLLMAVAGNAAYQLLSRSLARSETTVALLLNSAIAGSVCFGSLVPWSLGGPPLSLRDALLFATIGMASGLGHYLLTASFRLAPVSVLGPVTYMQLMWAGILGWVVFGHVPDALSILGMIVICCAGAAVVMRR